MKVKEFVNKIGDFGTKPYIYIQKKVALLEVESLMKYINSSVKWKFVALSLQIVDKLKYLLSNS